MSDNQGITSAISKDLTSNLIDTFKLAQNLTNSQSKLDNLPSVVDNDTLNEIKNGGYGITLKDYTKLSTYQSTMSVLYGDNSADKFSNYINKLYGKNSDNNGNTVSTKEFLEKMREKGISNKSAMKIYSAIQKYSTTEIFNNSFLSAKI